MKQDQHRQGARRDSGNSAAWPLFLTVHAEIIARIEARLEAEHLPELSWYDMLWALERAEEQRLRMTDLAQQVVLSPSNVTRLADRLEAAGLVKRERDPSDRRVAYAVLTPEGRKLRSKMWPVYRKAIADLFADHLTAEEAATLEKVFRRMLVELRREGG